MKQGRGIFGPFCSPEDSIECKLCGKISLINHLFRDFGVTFEKPEGVFRTEVFYYCCNIRRPAVVDPGTGQLEHIENAYSELFPLA